MDPFELRLATVLRADAERAVIDIDAVAIADEAMRAPGLRGRRRSWLLPAVVAALLGASLLGGALLSGSAPDRAEIGPLPMTPGDGTMAVLLRLAAEPWGSVEVVGLRPGGAEQVLRTLTPFDLPDGGWFSPTGHVSERGALAVHVGRNKFALMSLVRPERPMVTIAYQPVIGGRWSPTDLFATISTAPGTWSIRAVGLDGTAREFGPIRLPGGGPDIVWAADGSGILTVLESGTSASGLPFHRYAIAPIDDGPNLPDVPDLSFGWGRRYVAEGGRTLDVCTDRCSLRSTPSIWVSEPNDRGGFGGGEVLPDDVPGTLVDASFAAGDGSIWMLFDRTTDGVRDVVLGRLPESGSLSIVATISVDPATEHVWFDAFAADDSLIGVGHWVTGGDDRVVTIVDPATGRSVTTGDTVIGYLTGQGSERP